MAKSKPIKVKGTDIVMFIKENEDYISITDIARFKNAVEPKDIVKTGCEAAVQVNSWDYGKKYINQILKGSNSTPLCTRLEATRLYSHPRNG